MRDNSNLSYDALQEACNYMDKITDNAKPAATSWLKYEQTSILSPNIGEWCLWSMIENGKRNYFTGSLFMSDCLLMLSWDGFRPVVPDDTLYYARVNKMVFPEMSKEEFENKSSKVEFQERMRRKFRVTK